MDMDGCGCIHEPFNSPRLGTVNKSASRILETDCGRRRTMREPPIDPRTPIKAMLFDLDDTLIDLREASYISFNETLRRYGLRTVTYNEMLANWDTSWRGYLKGLISSGVGGRVSDGAQVDALLMSIGKDYMARFEEIHLNHSRILPGALEALRSLDGMGVLITIVSRRSRRVIEEELDKFNLRQYVDYVVGWDDVKRQKPAPDGLLLASERLMVPIEECLLVGDSPSDIKAGKASGARTVAVLTGPYEKEKLLDEGPDLVVESVASLIQAIERVFRLEGLIY